MWQSVFLALKNGDIYFIILAVFVFLALFSFITRFILLNFVYNINFEKFIDQIKLLVKSGESEQALEYCRKTSNVGFARISEKAIEAGIGDPSTVRGVVEEEVVSFLPRLEKGCGFLSMLGGLSVLVGVTGTISGLWTNLYSMEVIDTTEKQLAVGMSIASSLNYTMCSLIVCIACVIGSFYIKSFATNLSNKIFFGVSVIHNLYPQTFGIVPGGYAMSDNLDKELEEEKTETYKKEEEEEVFEAAPQEETEKSDTTEFTEVDEIKDEEEII